MKDLYKYIVGNFFRFFLVLQVTDHRIEYFIPEMIKQFFKSLLIFFSDAFEQGKMNRIQACDGRKLFSLTQIKTLVFINKIRDKPGIIFLYIAFGFWMRLAQFHI